MERITYEIIIEGPGVEPSGIPAKLLADMLRAFELAIEHHAVTLGVKDKVVAPVSLIDITEGSAAFSLSIDHVFGPVYDDMTIQICAGRISDFAKDTQTNWLKFQTWAREKNWTFRFHQPEAAHGAEIVIDPIDGLLASGTPVFIRGGSTLIGECIRLGGKEPKVDIRQDSGHTIHAEASREIVRQLADRLYQRISVEGVATWDARTWEVRGFKIESVNPYQPTNLLEAFAELRRLAEGAWDDVDAEDFVHNQRED